MIPALVLTAGLATRLRPLSLVRAKAALPVAGEPLVRRILRSLAGSGVRDVVLNLHWRADSITAAVGDGADLGLRVRYSWEYPVLGSAGGPRRALPLLHPEAASASSFLILNGDTLTDVRLPDVVAAHRESGALVTMAVTPNSAPEKYGGALVDSEGVITGFVRSGSTQPSWHVVGVQVAEPEAFASVPEGQPYETVRTLYPDLIARHRGSVRAFRCEAEFFDIGTPSDYLATSLLLHRREPGSSLAGARNTVDVSARLTDTILWDDVVVESGAHLRECVVTDGVRVPADTSWHGVILRRADGALLAGEREYDGMAISGL